MKRNNLLVSLLWCIATSLIAIRNADLKLDTSSLDTFDEPSNKFSAQAVITNLSGGKRTLYMHVGPPKTATTSLQCSFCSQNVTNLLLDHNIKYIGSCPPRSCKLKEIPPGFLSHRFSSFYGTVTASDQAGIEVPKLIPSNWTEPRTFPPISVKLQHSLQQAYLDGHDAIIVYEGLHRPRFNFLAALSRYLSPQWNVKIIVAYRRYSDWLPSKFNSVMKKKLRTKSWRQPVIPAFSLDLPERQPELVQFRDMMQKVERQDQHPTETIVRNYQHFFDDVQVWNIHEAGESLSQAFLCDVLHIACDVQWGPEAYNPSRNLEFDRLAVAAYRKGLVVREAKRKAVGTALAGAMSKVPLPKKCWSEADTEQLSTMSRDFEVSLFRHMNMTIPDPYPARRLCALNVNEALQEPQVAAFFQRYNEVAKRKYVETDDKDDEEEENVADEDE